MLIEIFMNNYNTAYFPGQSISGRIECTFTTKTNLRAVRVKFRGRAKTAWSESRRISKTRVTTIEHSAKETYMDAEYNLVGGGENFSLAAGKHVYPFSYDLPPRLPSSFEGGTGSIRYYVKAIVDRPWKLDYKIRLPLTVAAPIDLNFIPSLRNPVVISGDKTLCSYWCNKAGALTFNASLPIGGYVPGQAVNVAAHIENLTNITVQRVQFKITVHYEFITHHPHKHIRHNYYEVAKCEESGVRAHSEKSWTSTLIIPANRKYPNLIHCKIINVFYNLEAKVVVPCPGTNLKLSCPLQIGSVALAGVHTTIPGPPWPNPQFGAYNPSAPLMNSEPPGYSQYFYTAYPEECPPPYQKEPPPYSPRTGIGATAPPPAIVPSYTPSAEGSAPQPLPTGRYEFRI